MTSEPAEQKPGTAEIDVQWRFARTRQLFLAMVHLGVRSKRMSEAVEGLLARYKSSLPDSFWSALVYTPPTGEYDFPRPRASEAEARITLDASHLEEDERFSVTSMTGSLGFVGFDLDRFHLAFSAWKGHILQCREALDLASLEVDAAYGTQHGLPSVQIREVIDRMQASLPYDPEMQDGVQPPSDILSEDRIKQACGPLGEWTNRLRSMAHIKQPTGARRDRVEPPEAPKTGEKDPNPATKAAPTLELLDSAGGTAEQSNVRAQAIEPELSRIPDWLEQLDITPNEWAVIDVLAERGRGSRVPMLSINPARGPNHVNSVRRTLRRLADCDPSLVDYPKPVGRGRHPGVKLTAKGFEAHQWYRQRWSQVARRSN